MNSKANSHLPSLGTLLREKRNQKGLTLKQAATRLGVSFAYVADIERGRRDPSDELLGRIAETFDIDVRHLQKLDKRVSLASLRLAINQCPAIALELRRVLSGVNEGQIRPERLVQQLSKLR